MWRGLNHIVSRRRSMSRWLRFLFGFLVCLMVFNATFNNISVISWWFLNLLNCKCNWITESISWKWSILRRLRFSQQRRFCYIVDHYIYTVKPFLAHLGLINGQMSFCDQFLFVNHRLLSFAFSLFNLLS
jgi:hypothetical protein